MGKSDVVHPDWPPHPDAFAAERRAIRRDLIALAERARKAGLTGAALVLEFAAKQALDAEWPREPE